MYVSITGLRLRSRFHFFKFISYTIPIILQAKTSQGNIITKTTYNDGIYFTVTIWKDKKSMNQFILSGIHGKAMKILNEISYDGRTYGYETTKDIPQPSSWDEIYNLWHEKAKHYHRHYGISKQQQHIQHKQPQRNFYLFNNMFQQKHNCYISFVVLLLLTTTIVTKTKTLFIMDF